MCRKPTEGHPESFAPMESQLGQSRPLPMRQGLILPSRSAPEPSKRPSIYRFFLNLYCSPTEIAKFTSVCVILFP